MDVETKTLTAVWLRLPTSKSTSFTATPIYFTSRETVWKEKSWHYDLDTCLCVTCMCLCFTDMLLKVTCASTFTSHIHSSTRHDHIQISQCCCSVHYWGSRLRLHMHSSTSSHARVITLLLPSDMGLVTRKEETQDPEEEITHFEKRFVVCPEMCGTLQF